MTFIRCRIPGSYSNSSGHLQMWSVLHLEFSAELQIFLWKRKQCFRTGVAFTRLLSFGIVLVFHLFNVFYLLDECSEISLVFLTYACIFFVLVCCCWVLVWFFFWWGGGWQGVGCGFAGFWGAVCLFIWVLVFWCVFVAFSDSGRGGGFVCFCGGGCVFFFLSGNVIVLQFFLHGARWAVTALNLVYVCDAQQRLCQKHSIWEGENPSEAMLW